MLEYFIYFFVQTIDQNIGRSIPASQPVDVGSLLYILPVAVVLIIILMVISYIIITKLWPSMGVRNAVPVINCIMQDDIKKLFERINDTKETLKLLFQKYDDLVKDSRDNYETNLQNTTALLKQAMDIFINNAQTRENLIGSIKALKNTVEDLDDNLKDYTRRIEESVRDALRK